MRSRLSPAAVRFLYLIADLAAVNLAFLAAYWLRYIRNVGGEVLEQNFVDLHVYFPIQLILTAISAVTFAMAGLYRPGRKPLADQLVDMVGAMSIVLMLTLAVVFLYRGFAYSRWLFVFIWAGSIVLLGLARSVRYLIVEHLRRRGIGVERVVVVGGGEPARLLMHVITTEPGLGYHLVGFLQVDSAEPAGRFPCLGGMADLAAVAQSQRIGEVMIALPSNYRSVVPHLIAACEEAGLAFRIVPDLYELSLTRVDVLELRGIPLVGLKPVAIRGLNFLTKRVFDAVAAGLVLVLLCPLWLTIAIAIKLDSQGPVLFSQRRIGRNCRPFQAYKFRSMRQGAEEEQARLARLNEAGEVLFKIKNDPRVTRVGRWLRRTSLDEVPQLINVLTGNMSLVGPRPPLPTEVEQYDPWHVKRLEVMPGITGLWQVSGRSQLPFDEMVMLDIYYIENWSLGLDFEILLRTIPAVISGRGAY